MLISIIIPFYDNDYEKINIISKEFEKLKFDYEVIFVDDRNDKSFPIEIPNKCKLVRSHETFNNVGTFEARRAGALVATGDYIWFVDIDDKLCNIKQLPKNNEDIAAYEYYLNNNHIMRPSHISSNFNRLEIHIKNINTVNVVLKRSCLGLWNKLFKREVVLKTYNNIPFLKNFTKNEDGYTYFQILKNSDLVTFKFDRIYIYCNPYKHSSYMRELKRKNELEKYLEEQIPIECNDRDFYINFMKNIV